MNYQKEIFVNAILQQIESILNLLAIEPNTKINFIKVQINLGDKQNGIHDFYVRVPPKYI